MYMFSIKPSVVSEMAPFHKKGGMLKYFAPVILIRWKIYIVQISRLVLWFLFLPVLLPMRLP